MQLRNSTTEMERACPFPVVPDDTGALEVPLSSPALLPAGRGGTEYGA